MQRKYYLIDTENVGDRWIDFIENLREEEILVVFYTKNHSKLLEENYLRQRYNQQIRWVECMVGSNALDHQLMGVLSYLIATHGEAAYWIFSNDTGYQNVVDFWKQRNVNISMVGYTDGKKKEKKEESKDSANHSRPSGSHHLSHSSGAAPISSSVSSASVIAPAQSLPVTALGLPASTAASALSDLVTALGQPALASALAPSAPASDSVLTAAGTLTSASAGAKLPDIASMSEEEQLTEIARVVPTERMSEWYAVLVALMGQETGRGYYMQLKEQKERREELSRHLMKDVRGRNIRLIQLLYLQNRLDTGKAAEAYKIVSIHNCKNKKAIKADFEKHFGKKNGKGAQYYKVIKPVLELLKGK